MTALYDGIATKIGKMRFDSDPDRAMSMVKTGFRANDGRNI
jgi:hypothetical protein